MPAQPQQRDSHRRFIQTIQHQQAEDLSQQIPQPAGSRYYCAFIVASAPFFTDIPVSKAVTHASAIWQSNLPEHETLPSPPLAFNNILFSPIRYVPLYHVTDPPIPPPDFNASRSDNIVPPVSPPLQLEEFELSMHCGSNYHSDNRLSFADDEDFVPVLPPLPPCPLHPLPQHPRYQLCTRPLPQLLCARALPQLLYIPLPAPATVLSS